jgi:arsenate reductase (glutaredoxin)
MKATIWHNPNCGTSRKTLAILEETPNIQLTVIDYQKQPYDRETLTHLFAAADIRPRDALRVRGTNAEELGLIEGASDYDILDHMIAQPILVERPFVETEKGVRLCRPQETVHQIL